jgi:hypothetical protein
MLKTDKEALIDLVSGDVERGMRAVAHLDALEKGHFEDHRVSAALVREKAHELAAICKCGSVQGAKRWAVQFLAEARVMTAAVKNAVLETAREPACSFLPSVLYLIGSNVAEFEDAGPELETLSGHADPEVRWRVAWVISRMRNRDVSVRRALANLCGDTHPTTQVYVRAAEG